MAVWRHGDGSVHGLCCLLRHALTIDLQVSYHRPLIPGEDVLIRVKVVSVTKSLMYLSSEASQVSRPDRICITSTATFFYKPMPIV